MIQLPRSKQEIFNLMVIGFAKQGWRQASLGGTCRYYFEDINGDPLRCAVGLLLPVETAKFCADWGSLGTLFNPGPGRPTILAPVSDEIRDFLFDAQNAHDHVADTDALVKSFEYLAERHGLKFKRPDLNPPTLPDWACEMVISEEV